MSKVRPTSGYGSTSKNKGALSNSRKRPVSAKPHSQVSKFTTSVQRTDGGFVKGDLVYGCTDAKMIPTIHAYNPQSLKKCLVVNPRSYKKFYDQQGSCELTKLYTTSFIAHFREWRKNLRHKIVIMLDRMAADEVVDEGLLSQILQELKGIVEEIKQSIESILSSKYSSGSVGELKKQEHNFASLKEYIESLLVIVHYLSKFVKAINEVMGEGAECNVK